MSPHRQDPHRRAPIRGEATWLPPGTPVSDAEILASWAGLRLEPAPAGFDLVGPPWLVEIVERHMVDGADLMSALTAAKAARERA